MPRIARNSRSSRVKRPFGVPTSGDLTLAHLRQRLLGGDAAIHDPDPIGSAIVARSARENPPTWSYHWYCLAGQRKTRGHDQGNHHLYTVRAFVTAVAVLAFTGKRRITFEVGAGQVVRKTSKCTSNSVSQRPRRNEKNARLCATSLSKHRYKVARVGIGLRERQPHLAYRDPAQAGADFQ